ncbi:MAG TPA: enoyl-CoA hydratase [Thermodesulfobacteriota bacterium]|nr:enoyl-CoA hydratase [Thermodesulfobacteriota bacterium]
MAYETLLLEKKDGIGVLTMNRPDRMNAFNQLMEAEFVEALKEADLDDEIRVLVLAAAGKSFCAGADVQRMSAEERERRPRGAEDFRRGFRNIQGVILGLQRLEKPTIAMINGPAVGGGFDLACACDIRIGCEKARFMVAFTRIGLFPGWGGTWLYPRIIGIPKAAEMLFTGDFLEAKDAERYGLLNRLVPSEDLQKETMVLARRIADGPPVAIRLSKLQLYKGLQMDLETAMKIAAACETITLTSEDHKEGVAAFKEKRKPSYKGK